LPCLLASSSSSHVESDRSRVGESPTIQLGQIVL
jgi:hypothetical protein